MKTKNIAKLKAGDAVRLPGSDRWALVRQVSERDGETRISYVFEGDASETPHRYKCLSAKAGNAEIKVGGVK